jgi:cytochrome b561
MQIVRTRLWRGGGGLTSLVSYNLPGNERMQLGNTRDGYGAVAKFLHWAIVILIIAQYVIIESAEDLPDGIEKLSIITRHKSLGMLVLLLVVARIGWKLVNRGKPAPVAMPPWQRISAAAGHGLLYLLILLQPLSGWAMSSAANYPVTLFGWFQFPALVAPNHDLHEGLEELHEVLFYAMVVIAVVHVAAALYHHFWLKDDTLRRMLPLGRKSTG